MDKRKNMQKSASKPQFESPAVNNKTGNFKTENKSIITSAQRKDYDFAGRDLSRNAHQWGEDDDLLPQLKKK